MGNVIIAEASPETMAYVAGYVTKKTYGNDNKRYRELGLTPPYCCMSRNPGLGYDYYTSHKEQMYADDGLYFNGKKGRYRGTLIKNTKKKTRKAYGA